MRRTKALLFTLQGNERGMSLHGSSITEVCFLLHLIKHGLTARRIDTTGGTREIMNKLHEIETMLHSQTSLISNFPRGDGYSSSLPSIRSPPNNPVGTVAENSSIPNPSPWLAEIKNNSDMNLPPMSIPPEHKTSSTYLLSLPQVRSLVGDYPPDLFFHLESNDNLPFESGCDSTRGPEKPCQIDEVQAAELVSAFFSSAHQQHPVLDENEFHGLYSRFLENGPDSSVESALCMVVLAIGEATITPADTLSLKSSPPGMRYMHHALPTLLHQSSWSFSFSLVLPQALVLSSIYYAYIVRPLRSWRMVYSAATILQLQLSRYEYTCCVSLSYINLYIDTFHISELPRRGSQSSGSFGLAS